MAVIFTQKYVYLKFLHKIWLYIHNVILIVFVSLNVYRNTIITYFVTSFWNNIESCILNKPFQFWG